MDTNEHGSMRGRREECKVRFSRAINRRGAETRTIRLFDTRNSAVEIPGCPVLPWLEFVLISVIPGFGWLEGVKFLFCSAAAAPCASIRFDASPCIQTAPSVWPLE
jgi:hypothetical protein